MPLFGTRKHPKGPNMRSARWLRFDYSGNVFELKVPPNTEDRYSVTIGAPFRNIYDMSKFVKDDDDDNSPMVYSGGHRENWTYKGLPIIDGCLGHMSIYIALLQTTFHGNLLHPANLETHLNVDVDRRYGPKSTKGGGDYGGCMAPLNWQVVTINGCTWTHYEVESAHNDKFYSVWNTPLSASHILEVGFDSQENTRQKYCRASFEDTLNQIVSTFKITLSQASLQDKHEAETQWPNAQYSSEFPEKPWSIANRKAYQAKGMLS